MTATTLPPAAAVSPVSLLALLGVRHPVKLLPALLFEITGKLLRLSLVALPGVMDGTLDPAATQLVARGDRWQR